MDKKTKNLRPNAHTCLSGKSKSTLNSARSMTSQNPEKNVKPKSALDQQSSRIFRFSMSPNQMVKKEYKKNSDKMIKPPEKHNGGGKSLNNTNNESNSNITTKSVERRKSIQRGVSDISHTNSSVAVVSERSLTENFDENVFNTFTRVDTKTINELEERLESLQSVLLRKMEILKNREPEKLKKEYKFIAVVTDDESKLVIKENDAKRFPHVLPAKSVEDLNRKAGEFFKACLLLFIDKLRAYQETARSIDCDEIYEELKKEEKDYCCFLENWLSEFHDNENTSEKPLENPTIEVHCQEIQTELSEEKSNNKDGISQEVQTDPLKDQANEKSSALALLTIKMDKLRLENYELKDQLREQNEKYMIQMKALEDCNKGKVTELSEFLKEEKNERTKTENSFKKEQKMNSDLSLQIMDLQDELSDLRKKYEETISQQKETMCAKSMLEKYGNEIEHLRAENSELHDLKTNLLKKLDKRYAQYELMEKEIKLQKRMVRTKTEEIEQIKKQFDSKIKDNRMLKDSLEARNKLIDHLRNAVEIDQKKIRELEIKSDCKRKSSGTTDTEMNQREEKQKRYKPTEIVKSRGTIGVLFRQNEQNNVFNGGISQVVNNEEQKIKIQQKPRGERRKKNNLKLRDDDIEPFNETSIGNISTDAEKTPMRNIRPFKRTRDIIVKKYEL